MSDIYLVLRNRLDSVAEWVTLGPEMRTARERLGLSRAAISRQIPVVEKTYERWEKRGQVPRTFLPAVAKLLQLEIESPDQVKIAVTPSEDSVEDRLARIEATLEELADVRETADRIEALLLQQAGTPRERQASASNQ